MNSIRVRTFVGNNGILQIQLPPEVTNQELDVIIVFQPIAEESLQPTTKTPEELGYSRKFLEEVIGSWEGDPLELPEQLPFEEREEIQLVKFVGILSDSETEELQQVIKNEFEQVDKNEW